MVGPVGNLPGAAMGRSALSVRPVVEKKAAGKRRTPKITGGGVKKSGGKAPHSENS